MSLDQNLFTLHLTPHKQYPNVIDLVDSSGNIHYRKQRTASSEYKIEIYDPLSESLLITATSPSVSSKTKILELKNPTHTLELRYTGTISFRWGFKWEEHEFEWKREECFMLRKPDPPVLVAVSKEANSRLKNTTVQILDYNLNRFDVDDRKGLELVILTALLTFSDANEQSAIAPPPPSSNSRAVSSPSNVKPPATILEARPLPPPKPAPKTGMDRIAELQAIRGEYNEVTVEDEGSVEHYAQYCSNLLSDDAMLFITVKSAENIHVPKVLQVVEEAKRIRHKAGLSEEEELHQYVLYDTRPTKKGPRRIKLDDDDKNKQAYVPPNSLTIHLSKIPMPELQPKVQPGDKGKKDGRTVLPRVPSPLPHQQVRSHSPSPSTPTFSRGGVLNKPSFPESPLSPVSAQHQQSLPRNTGKIQSNHTKTKTKSSVFDKLR
ncbi:hypothetical protein Agabi119p4_6520 [Agaricus bisporus var. burnettii]|uniref:Uncharacterized protein n=1 Tax=Agaricus bisporus var. burnettii TaxID=192524 RepID=A0A8H7C9G8_AGABI|nr:hypothetical protein Agabi119p4_6520 [Agaricus bisporus var. burnettii]